MILLLCEVGEVHPNFPRGCSINIRQPDGRAPDFPPLRCKLSLRREGKTSLLLGVGAKYAPTPLGGIPEMFGVLFAHRDGSAVGNRGATVYRSAPPSYRRRAPVSPLCRAGPRSEGRLPDSGEAMVLLLCGGEEEHPNFPAEAFPQHPVAIGSRCLCLCPNPGLSLCAL